MRGGWIAIVVLLCVGLHWPGPDAQFTLDDFQFVSQNASIRSFSGALGSFDESFPPGQNDRGLYRPLTNLSYALDYALWGLSPRGYHITNVLLYGGIVLLVFGLARAYRLSTGLALAAALLFGLHPVHGEAVDAVAGRSEILSLAFSLASLICFKRALTMSSLSAQRQSGVSGRLPFAPALTASLVCYGLSCLSKETGVLLPGVLVFEVALRQLAGGRAEKARLRQMALMLVPFVALTAAYLILRHSAVGNSAPADSVLAGRDLFVRILTMGMVFAQYLRVLFFPARLETDLYYAETLSIPESWNLEILLGWMSLVLIGAGFSRLFIVQARTQARDSEPHPCRVDERSALLSGIAIFFCFLLPVSHIFDFGAVFAERFIFSPSVGFSLVIPILAWRGIRAISPPPRDARLIAATALAVFSLLAGWRSHERALDWRDEVRLWSRAQTHLPHNPPILANLGLAQLKRGNLDAAEVWLQESLVLDPHNLPALNSLASLMLERGDLAQAQEIYRHIVEADPTRFMAWNNLAVVEARRQNYSVAAQLYREALARNPHYASARENLVQVEAAIGEARAYLATFERPPEPNADAAILLRYSHACFVVGDFACASDYHRWSQAPEAASPQASAVPAVPGSLGQQIRRARGYPPRRPRA